MMLLVSSSNLILNLSHIQNIVIHPKIHPSIQRLWEIPLHFSLFPSSRQSPRLSNSFPDKNFTIILIFPYDINLKKPLRRRDERAFIIRHQLSREEKGLNGGCHVTFWYLWCL